MTFPSDIMQAAREAFIALACGRLDRATLARIRDGEFDTWPVYQTAAVAILAERQRCLEAVRAEMLEPDNPNYSPWDRADKAAEIALRDVLDAIQGLTT